MSTTIEPAHRAQTRPVRAARFAAAASGVVASWFTALALFTVLIEPGTTVNVFGPRPHTIGALLASDARLLSSGPGFITVWSQTPGFVRRLYAGGAWLVLPGSGKGCIALTNVRPTLAWAP